MGTMLQRAGIPPEQSPIQLNVTAPEIVQEVHRLYALAGAHCATTNSFGGSRAKLAVYGLEDQVTELNRAAVRLLGPWHFRWKPADFAGFTDHAGRLSADVRPGEYRLEVLVPGQTIEDGKPWQTEVEIPPGPGEPLTLHVPRRP